MSQPSPYSDDHAAEWRDLAQQNQRASHQAALQALDSAQRLGHLADLTRAALAALFDPDGDLPGPCGAGATDPAAADCRATPAMHLTRKAATPLCDACAARALVPTRPMSYAPALRALLAALAPRPDPPETPDPGTPAWFDHVRDQLAAAGYRLDAADLLLGPDD